MKLVIAEKPSVAADIAQVIGAETKKKDFFEGNGYRVTWLHGHLLEIHTELSEGKWTTENLPILPQTFSMKPVKENGSYGKPRIEVIRELMEASDVDMLIEATDAGREGEAIFRNVYNYCRCTKPFQRLWISSMTNKAIEEGFGNLKPGRDYDNLADAALLRSYADWVIGVNCTRALTLTCKCRTGIVLSLGRVQTPTLAMICKRYIQNKRFVPEPFWYLQGECTKDNVPFRFRGTVRHTQKAGAEEDYAKVQATGSLTVENVETERKTEAPPLLHDIDSLMQAADVRYGFSPDHTLAMAQSLYEKKITTYPRTGSRYIPVDVYEMVPDLMKTLLRHPTLGDSVKRLVDRNQYNRRSVDDDKITDHHALIITGNDPSRLSEDRRLTEDEEKIYDIIVTRFVEAFSPEAVADVTRVALKCDDVDFEARGRKEVYSGWKGVANGSQTENVELSDVDEIELSMKPLPEMKEGDVIKINAVEIIEDETKPKPLLTRATLISAMINAGRGNDDRNVVNALKDIGIGTPATRAEIIKTLFERDFIKLEKRKLVPTRLGLLVYTAVWDKDIAKVEMTAHWETGLNNVERGTLEMENLKKEIYTSAKRLTKEILEGKGYEKIMEEVAERIIPCPKCGSKMIMTDKLAFCSNREGCTFKIFREIAKKKLSDSSMEKLILKGETGFISGFVSRSDKTFTANVKRDGNGNTTLEFENGKK